MFSCFFPEEFAISTINGATLVAGTYAVNIECNDGQATNVVNGIYSVPVTDEVSHDVTSGEKSQIYSGGTIANEVYPRRGYC